MARPRIPLDVEDLVRRYQAGETVLAIAESVGVSHTAIQMRLRERGVLRKVAEDMVRHKRETMLELPTDIVDRYRAGESTKQIADSLGVSRNVVDLRLHEAGVHTIERRTTRESRTSRGRQGSRERQAQTAERRRYKIGSGEVWLADALAAKNMHVRPQAAIGRYNVDVLVQETIAVEMMTCTGTPYHHSRYAERLKYILDRHTIVVVWSVGRHVLVPDGMKKVVALCESLCRDPAHPGGQYWVIRGTGEIATRGDDPHDITFVPPSVRAAHTKR